MPKVSVVIPIYNVELYIEKCARSLFEQTLDDIEYIFVNDNTKDCSMDILYAIMAQYPHRRDQVKIINHDKNYGAAIARKNGILAATGEYLIHCDSDDWADPLMYEQLYDEAKRNNLDIVICQYYEKREKSSVIVAQHLGDNPKSTIIANPLYCSLCNKLVKRSLLSKNFIYYPEYHMMEDALLCAQIFYYANTVGYVDSPLYYYRINDASVCHVSSAEGDMRRWSEGYANVKMIELFLKKNNVDKKYRNELILSKANVRGFLMPQFKKNNKFYNLWSKTFPELNWQYFFSHGPSCSLKIVFFLTLLGIYPTVYKLRCKVIGN